MAQTSDRAPAVSTSQMPFDARVQPYWYPLHDRQHPLGFFGGWKRKRQLTTLLHAINGAIRRQAVEPADWAAKESDCVCNLRIDRLGVLQDLRTFAAQQDNQSATEIYSGSAESRFTHLIKNRDRRSYYVPVDFPEPIMIHDADTRDLLPIGSSVRLLRELLTLNKILRVQDTFQIRKMVDFLQATAKDISRYETTYANDPLFWVKFGYILLDKLARQSVDGGLPIVFG
ncbi:MAG: hypothetical protein HYZ53_24745 [Planctomycetes bacterium]|nr:hypothetical protein [Planctomycetota bacterium]